MKSIKRILDLKPRFSSWKSDVELCIYLVDTLTSIGLYNGQLRQDIKKWALLLLEIFPCFNINQSIVILSLQDSKHIQRIKIVSSLLSSLYTIVNSLTPFNNIKIIPMKQEYCKFKCPIIRNTYNIGRKYKIINNQKHIITPLLGINSLKRLKCIIHNRLKKFRSKKNLEVFKSQIRTLYARRTILIARR